MRGRLVGCCCCCSFPFGSEVRDGTGALLRGGETRRVRTQMHRIACQGTGTHAQQRRMLSFYPEDAPIDGVLFCAEELRGFPPLNICLLLFWCREQTSAAPEAASVPKSHPADRTQAQQFCGLAELFDIPAQLFRPPRPLPPPSSSLVVDPPPARADSL